MLEISAFVLFLGWLLGMISAYTWGGLIHILLVAAVVLRGVRLLRGKRDV